jgi:uncharacterized membrane protein YdbT with pleckstrin-like domain
MRELEKVLNADEKVLWEGGPSFWPFFIGRSTVLTFFGIIWMLFLLPFIFTSGFLPGPFKYTFLLMPHFWIGLFMLFGPTIYTLLVFKHTYYAITDKRVILQTGWIGRDFNIIDFDKITNSSVNVSLIDKIFGRSNTGNILVISAGSFSGNRSSTFQQALNTVIASIQNPYEVFKFLKKTQFDVKADIQYPNKLRPDSNPGYQTNYKPDQK